MAFKSSTNHREAPVTKSFLMGRALRFLARREYGALELAKKLQQYTDNEALIAEVLQELQAKNWQSDSRYVAQKIHQRASKFGQRRIVQELEQQGVSVEFIQEAKTELLHSEERRLWDVWQKKFGVLFDDPRSYAKQVRFLLARGFSSELIHTVFKKIKNQAKND